MTSSGLFTLSIPISKVWVSKRPFNDTLWLPAYFKLEDAALWQSVDLSALSGEKKLQVQILHNNNHQNPLWKHQVIPKTCINILFCVANAWSFEFSANLLDSKQLKAEFEHSQRRFQKQTSSKQLDVLHEDDSDFDDEEEKASKAQIHENNRKGEEIAVSLSTDIPKLIRIANKKKSWGIVMECPSPVDVAIFATWWTQLKGSFWVNPLNQDLFRLSAELHSNSYAEAIKEFYKSADPTKTVEDIERVLLKYDSKLVALMNMLWHKYGSHPIVAMKDILIREAAPQLILRASKRKEKMLMIKEEYARREAEEKARKQEEKQQFIELLKEFCRNIPTSSFASSDESNRKIKKKRHVEGETFSEEESDSFFKVGPVSMLKDIHTSKGVSSKKRTASELVANGMMSRDQSHFQLIQTYSTNVRGYERFEVDYYINRETSFAVSLPMLPNAVLFHVSARNWKSASVSTSDIASWCHLELNRYDDNRYYTGVVNKDRAGSENIVLDIDIEWNCSWFDESKIVLPSRIFSDIVNTSHCKFSVELPERLPHVPLEIRWESRFEDWEVNVSIPSKWRRLEIFLFFANRLLRDGEMELLHDTDDIDEEVDLPHVDFTKFLQPLLTLHHYPDIVYNDAKDGYFQGWFNTNVLGHLKKTLSREISDGESDRT